MSNSPLVTIGIPVYNAEKYLQQALNSVISQEYLNLEIIICDNASTDTTQSICQDFIKLDDRIRYHRHSYNIGTIANFNYVLDIANGEFFTWLAHDDFFAQTYISKCVDRLMSQPQLIGCCSEIEFINEDGSPRSSWTQYYQNIDCSDKNIVSRVREITSRVGWYAIYSIFRTKILRQIDRHQSRYAADVMMLIELLIIGEIDKVPEHLFYYRVSDIDKTPDDYSRALGLDADTTAEVLKGSFTYIAKQILNIVCDSNISVQDKYRIKEDFINVLCCENIDLRERILSEQNFSVEQDTTDRDIRDLLERIIISDRVDQFFVDNPPLPLTKSLVFFPHNPYPIATGAHRRCLEMLAGLREKGCEITLFSSNIYTDRPWTQESVDFLKSKYDIDTFIYQATEDDLRYLESCRAKSSPDKMNWDYFNAPGLMQSFKQVSRQLKPSLVMVSYALWGRLVDDRVFDCVVKVLDTIDVFSLTMQMFRILNPYFDRSQIDPQEVASEITDEDFFVKLDILPDREEYSICDLYDYTIAISQKEASLFEQNTERTQIIYTPMAVEVPAVVNNYSNNPLFVISGNNFNLQGATYFVQKVLPIVCQDIPDFKLQVIGDGGKRLEAVPAFEILGYVRDLSDLYAQSSFAICPLIGGTGQQVKIVEAMAHGLPVIALRNVGENSAIQHGINGFIAKDAAEFAKYTVMLSTNRLLCEQMGKAARQHIQANFSRSTIVASLQNIIASAHEVKWDNNNPQIVLDGVFFQLYNTGIARVWKSVLEEWSQTEFANHLVVLDRMGTAPQISGINYHQIPAYDYNNTDRDRQILQQACDDLGAELFISTYYTTPLETPSVFMGYDMIPEILGYNLSEPMWQEKHKGIEHASAYITISNHTAQDLVEVYPDIDLNNVTTAHCGVQPIFTPANDTDIAAFRYKYGISKPYFIIGANGGYKNVQLFLQAFAQLPTKSGFDLIVTGGHGLSDRDRQYTVGSTVHCLKLDDRELSIAHSGAIALVYPSKYEGFGLPIVEAFASACPVITCPNASIPEVAGEAAIYVFDDDIDGMAEALCEVQKPQIRSALIEAGLEQAKQFSWAKMADTIKMVLIDRTLSHIQFTDRNLIIFPDWSADEELLGEELSQIFYQLAQNADTSGIALIVDTSSIDIEIANDLISAVAMNLMMTEDIDITETLAISLTGRLAPIQWSALLPKLHGKIKLELENLEVIDLAHPQLMSEFRSIELADLVNV
jgi:glycosyltransferase involved in cell wall biosynthesis